MEWKSIAPWNWFKEEERVAPSPVRSGSEMIEPFDSIRSEFDRLFDAMQGRGAFTSRRKEGFEPLRPKVDISEAEKEYTVQAELPGIEMEDVAIEVVAGKVRISAEKRQDKESDDAGYHCVERAYGMIQRVLSLPEDADPENIDATFKNGVLTLRIPKQPARVAEGHRVNVLPG